MEQDNAVTTIHSTLHYGSTENNDCTEVTGDLYTMIISCDQLIMFLF